MLFECELFLIQLQKLRNYNFINVNKVLHIYKACLEKNKHLS
jgi:hypothetical protein